MSYPFNKGKLTAVSKLRDGNFSRTVFCSWRGDGYARRLAENGSNVLCHIVWPAKVHKFECRQIHDLHKEERQTTTRDVASSDGQKSAPSLAQSTPSNDTLDWKVADKQVAPVIIITDFGWEMLNSIPSPMIASGPPAPPELMKVVSCQCRTAGNACAQGNCSCFAAGLSCMTYCHCAGSQDECHNPLTKKYDDDSSDD